MSTQTATRSALHQAALDFAAAGYKVFPCVTGGKEPACKHGYKDATDDPAQINEWWEACPDYNVAMSPEDAGLAVIDAEHDADLDALELELGVNPDTYVVRTPRGGRHFYYEGSLPSTVRKLAPQVDTRGLGGYVLLPPSVVNGQPYTVENQQPCAPLPPSIEAKLAATEQSLSAATDDADLPANVERARRYLQDCVKRGDVAIEGKGGNNRTYQAAAWVRDLGISTDTALELIRDEWNPHCVPPWEADDLAGIVAHAYEYGQNEPGAYASAGTAAEAFAPALDRLRELARNAGATLADDTLGGADAFQVFEPWQFKDRPAPSWIVDGMVREKGTHVLFGKSESMKTFLTLDVLASVATGKPVFGSFKVFAPGDVVFFCDEEPDDLMKVRWPAWCKARGIADPFANPIDGPGRFVVIPRCPLIANPDDVEGAINCIRARGLRPKVIAIDTMAKAMVGMDQDSARDTGVLYAAMSYLRRVFGAATWITHHPKKGDPDEMRGSSAQTNDADVVWQASRTADTFAVKLISRKMKGAPKPVPLHVMGKLYPVDSLLDQHGRQITAPVFDLTAAPQREHDAQASELKAVELSIRGQVLAVLVKAKQLGHDGLDIRQLAEGTCPRKRGEHGSDWERRLQNERRKLQYHVRRKGNNGCLAPFVELDSRGEPIEPYRFRLPDDNAGEDDGEF